MRSAAWMEGRPAAHRGREGALLPVVRSRRSGGGCEPGSATARACFAHARGPRPERGHHLAGRSGRRSGSILVPRPRHRAHRGHVDRRGPDRRRQSAGRAPRAGLRGCEPGHAGGAGARRQIRMLRRHGRARSNSGSFLGSRRSPDADAQRCGPSAQGRYTAGNASALPPDRSARNGRGHARGVPLREKRRRIAPAPA